MIRFFAIYLLILTKIIAYDLGKGFVMEGNVDGSGIVITQIDNTKFPFPRDKLGFFYQDGIFLANSWPHSRFLGIIRSINGYNWTTVINFNFSEQFYTPGFAKGSGVSCIVANNAVYKSIDPLLIDWTLIQVNPFNLTSISFVKDRFFALGDDGNLHVANQLCRDWKTVGIPNTYKLAVLHYTGNQLLAIKKPNNDPNNLVIFSSESGMFDWKTQTLDHLPYGEETFTNIKGNTYLLSMITGCCDGQLFVKGPGINDLFKPLYYVGFPRMTYFFGNEQIMVLILDRKLIEVSYDSGITWIRIYDGSSNFAQPYMGIMMPNGKFLIFGIFGI